MVAGTVKYAKGRMRVERSEDGGEPVELNARVESEVGPDWAVLTIQAPAGSFSLTLETKDRKTIYFLGQLDGALRAVQYRLSDVTPILKQPTGSIGHTSRGMFDCPVCDRLLPDCGLCDGKGEVSERTLEQWMVDNGEIVG